MDNQRDIGAHSDWETWGKGQKRRLGHAEPGNRDALLCQIPREISIGYQVAKKAWIWQCICLVGKHPSIFTILIYSYHLFVRWSTPFFFFSLNMTLSTQQHWRWQHETWPICHPSKSWKDYPLSEEFLFIGHHWWMVGSSLIWVNCNNLTLTEPWNDG